jgi:glutamate formiminotransferase
MNLTNFAETPLDEVLKAIGPLAREGEIIGFVPKRAYQQAPDFFRFAANFSEDRILENRLAQLIP